MTSKEMEARSGVPRANIRYYEAEGLLAPARSGNGYRDYSEEDLRTLEKIKLLRRLGVTIEALRALRDGRAELSAVLEAAGGGGRRTGRPGPGGAGLRRPAADRRHIHRPGPGEVPGGPGRPGPAGGGRPLVGEGICFGPAGDGPAAYGVQRLPAAVRPDVR